MIGSELGNRKRSSGRSRLLRLGLMMALATVTASAVAEPVNFDLLKGAWVRPDGGYTIAIRSIGPNGQIEGMYFNPSQLPFAKAQATQEGATLRVSFELRAGGYDGSTYELTYDLATDRLKGVYYQAVAKQKFDVFSHGNERNDDVDVGRVTFRHDCYLMLQ